MLNFLSWWECSIIVVRNILKLNWSRTWKHISHVSRWKWVLRIIGSSVQRISRSRPFRVRSRKCTFKGFAPSPGDRFLLSDTKSLWKICTFLPIFLDFWFITNLKLRRLKARWNEGLDVIDRIVWVFLLPLKLLLNSLLNKLMIIPLSWLRATSLSKLI